MENGGMLLVNASAASDNVGAQKKVAAASARLIMLISPPSGIDQLQIARKRPQLPQDGHFCSWHGPEERIIVELVCLLGWSRLDGRSVEATRMTQDGPHVARGAVSQTVKCQSSSVNLLFA
jgi:hypothetical protein